ncbi:glutamate-rich protein 5 [Grus japonensis]|uniref:Glutamate-rich protein 5 n=1 Tax=Grus japonensis TaxID=30415 RepID=A0ABC9W9U3_GRUJA
MILAVEEKIDLVSKREEPEGTEPLPAGAEESSELPSAWREESNGPSPPAPGEDAGVPPPEPAEDSGLVEGSDTSVVEIIKKVHITEEDNLVEGETGEQVETELLSEIVSGGPETKEEETGEAVDGAAATEIGSPMFPTYPCKVFWLGKKYLELEWSNTMISANHPLGQHLLAVKQASETHSFSAADGQHIEFQGLGAVPQLYVIME